MTQLANEFVIAAEPLYDEVGVVVGPVKRAIIHCPLCEREFPGSNGGRDFVNHRCEG